MTGTSRSKRVIESITQSAKDAAEQQPEAVSPEAAPGNRDRSWEYHNRATPIRLGDSDARWLRSFAASHSITVGEAGRELIRTMHQAIEQGRVTVAVKREIEEYEDKAGHRRTRVHTELEANWQIPRP